MQTSSPQESVASSNKVLPFRWVIYAMCSYQIFIQWFILYAPTGLENQFIDDYSLTYADYALLFSIATGPTSIFPLFLGLVVDKLGVVFCAISSISILLIGNLIFVCAMYSSHPLLLMYVARCICGIGICYYGVTNNAILHVYFHNAELAFSLGIGPIHSRTGLAAGEFLSYAIYQWLLNSLGSSQMALIYVMWVTVILCTLSLLFETSVLLSKRAYIAEHKRFIAAHEERKNMSTLSEQDKSIYIKAKEYTLSFWIVIVIAGLGYLPFLGWMVTGTDALMTVYGFTQSTANYYLLIPNLSALIGCFVVGALIDKWGRIQIYFLLSGTIYFVWHLFFLYGDDLFNEQTDRAVVVFMLIIFGVGFSCFATTMWASVAILSGHAKIGMGNGIAFFSYAIFYAVGQYVVGVLIDINKDSANKYYWASIFLLFVSLAIITCAIILVIDDCRQKPTKLWKKHKQ